MMRLGRVLCLLCLLLLPACSRKAASIDVSPKKVKIYGIERTQRLTGRLLDRKGEPLEFGSPTWNSSNPQVVAVDPGGRLVAKGEGKATVTATYEEISAQVPVEIVDVSLVEVSPASAQLVGPPGTTLALSATSKNSKQKAVDIQPGWVSFDEKIAKVSPEGVVTSVANGTTAILAKLGDLQGASEISVLLREISRLELRPATALVRVGDSQHYQVIAYSPNGAPIENAAAIFRSSNPGVASIDGSGVAAGKRAGTATIRAELAGLKAEATLLVN